MKNEKVFEDTFNLLCGEKIGEGLHRQVYACKVRPDLVVKVESADYPFFANVFEQHFWDEYNQDKAVALWLAPCEFLSPDGRVLLQKRAEPLTSATKLPDKLPAFLTDVKKNNFGVLDGRIVCVDYAMYNVKPSMKLVKAQW